MQWVLMNGHWLLKRMRKKYGSSVAYLNPRIVSWTCNSGMLSEALQQLKTIHAPENLDLLSACELDERTSKPITMTAFFFPLFINTKKWNKILN